MTQAEPTESAETHEQTAAPDDVVEEAEAAAAADAADPTDDADEAATLEATVEELRAQHARAVADYQNLKRRQAEERREYTRLAQKTLVLNYLPVLDDLSRALDSVGDHNELDGHSWVEGMRMAQRKFLAVLEGSGVQPIEAEGEAFDPELHQAVSFQPGPEGRVVAVVQSGYTIDGLVIRPAVVLVGNGEGGPEQPGDNDSSNESDDESGSESPATAGGGQDETGTREGGEG
ncbi:MAG: nucleotide exchange factor GrpE [Dehalococcoidia bacterium]|jgi:molecular chaperone GrpE|nr:nucleotide exchange factor GrpE [Dehalococcoidia bacterium]